MIANVVIGLLVIAIGVGIIAGSNGLTRFFGQIARASRNLGSTRGLYVLIGFVLCVLGVLFMFGVLDANEIGDTSSSIPGIGGSAEF